LYNKENIIIFAPSIIQIRYITRINPMPTKEEVQKAYRNLNRVIRAVQEDKNIPEWRKMPIIDKLLDRKLEIQKWLFDYLEDEDFENKV
jgi:hypothetical protein